MNLFVVFKGADDGLFDSFNSFFHACSITHVGLEVVTAPLDGLILPGVTRDSVISLLREHTAGRLELFGLGGNVVINERAVTMKEVLEAEAKGTLVEMFGAGMISAFL